MSFNQGSRNGFLAITAQEYAAHIAYILALSPEGREQVYMHVQFVHYTVYNIHIYFHFAIPGAKQSTGIYPVVQQRSL